MAELLLKVKDTSTYTDGDIVCAFNQRRIGQVHAEHICHPSQVGFNTDGFREEDTVLEMYLSKTCEFKFVRVSKTEVKRIKLSDKTEDIIGDKANDKGEYLDIELFIVRRKKSPKHKVFGAIGAEVWYGGGIVVDSATLASVWQEIEARTDNKEVDHRLWPLTVMEKRNFLGLSVDDFDDVESGELTASEIDDSDPDNIIIITKRKHKVDYKAIEAISVESQEDIQDKEIIVDLRGDDKINERVDIVIVKEIEPEIIAIKEK